MRPSMAFGLLAALHKPVGIPEGTQQMLQILLCTWDASIPENLLQMQVEMQMLS